MQRYWLMKSEPEVYSIETLKRKKTGTWDGVRNFQARNFIREMRKGDLFLFYHSNAKPAGIAGVGKIEGRSFPDKTQFDSKSPYFDRRSTKDKPLWDAVTVSYMKTLPTFIPLEALKREKSLKGLALLQKGSRLSVMPVSKAHFQAILKLYRQGK